MHCHGCLVIRMSLVVRFDPTLTSFSTLDSLSFAGAPLIPNIVVSIEEFGLTYVYPLFCCDISLTCLSWCNYQYHIGHVKL